MSRNLCSQSCGACGGEVIKTSENRRATTSDVKAHDSYVGMLVADAECSECGAKYLAWVDIRGSQHYEMYKGHYMNEVFDLDEFKDLSYRSSFNDEPGEADLPVRYPWRCFARAMSEALVGVSKAMVASAEWWEWYEKVRERE